MPDSPLFNPRQNLVTHIIETHGLIVKIETQTSLSSDYQQIARNRIVLDEQWAYLRKNLARYDRLCQGMGYQPDPRIVELSLYIDEVLVPIYAEEMDAHVKRRGVERIIYKWVDFENAPEWRERMAQAERAVCRIEIDGHANGTGFLIGSDLVITCYHVIEPVFLNLMKHRSVVFRFDHKVLQAGAKPSLGQEYRLVSGGGWWIHANPEKQLDYALLRVLGHPGNQRVPTEPHVTKRGWLEPRPREMEMGEPIVTLQHPKGSSLKFAPGALISTKGSPPRLVYTANTLDGSSGSPCFTSNWNLIGLHKFGDPLGNEGVPFSAILKDMPIDIRTSTK